ncbi:MAG TPA: NADH-quinone oxidoreductase subunit NuoF [Anaerolineae bacterium]|nr:NADH-quinone oxidoreductase subunit NuoF [Anaerolineae bacterium]
MANIILRNQDIPDINDIDVYERNGGYSGLRKAVKEMTPEQVTDAVKASGLKGRGGAGFPTGVKWSFLPKGVFPRYLVVNADESEPGTFKDREIMEKNPHQFIEGVIISAYAIQCNHAFIYIRGEYPDAARILEDAIEVARARGYVGDKVLDSDYYLEITIHRGAGAYICGEETAMLDSLEGKLGMPRVKPPFPAAVGLYSKPTVINNVETLANIPPILEKGADWYKSIGTEKSTGPKVFCVSGHVNRPGNYEAPLGSITLRDLIFGEQFAQGVRDGKRVKGILTAGASAPMLTEQHLDTKLDYEAIAAAGSILGSASIIILNEDTDIPWAAQKMIEFFKHESCGKCTPCREGTYWLLTLLQRINAGEGKAQDIEMLSNVTSQMYGRTLCPLGDFATSPVTGTLKWFKGEYEGKVKGNGNPPN